MKCTTRRCCVRCWPPRALPGRGSRPGATRSRAVSALTIATGQIRGTPRSLLIEKRGGVLDEVIDKVPAALAEIGGADPYRGWAQAVVVEARQPAPH